jgi:hypothetical protein
MSGDLLAVWISVLLGCLLSAGLGFWLNASRSSD